MRSTRHNPWPWNFLSLLFHHKVSVITDQEPLIVVFKKYNIRILYKPEPQIVITDCPSRNYKNTNRDEEIPGMCITISEWPHACYQTAWQQKKLDDNVKWWIHGHAVRTILHGWPSTEAKVKKDLKSYWSF